ncbi:hypothetical protein TWF970_007508 [Orbilia oligospora]|uniref:Uncharacterized protein n=1 Tax=Orbilia oligospora TaxID=2813651 RepID=A0A7C8VBV9_ORBOL|nr:hypothetical protein TWF970_007508 [Orbilia oligospora]
MMLAGCNVVRELDGVRAAKDHRYPQVLLLLLLLLLCLNLLSPNYVIKFLGGEGRGGKSATSFTDALPNRGPQKERKKPEMQCEIMVLMWDHDLHSEYVGRDGI